MERKSWSIYTCVGGKGGGGGREIGNLIFGWHKNMLDKLKTIFLSNYSQREREVIEIF